MPLVEEVEEVASLGRIGFFWTAGGAMLPGIVKNYSLLRFSSAPARRMTVCGLPS